MQKPPSESKDEVYLRKRKVYSILSLVVLFAIFTAATALLWKPFAATFRDPAYFREWVNGKGLGGRFIFVGAVVLQMIFAIIPGEPLEVGAGCAFGAIEGALLCLAGAAIGSALLFFFTRKFGVKLVEVFVSREKLESLPFFNNRGNLYLLVFILFFIPGTPKDLFTYAIGLTPIKLGPMLLLTSIARIPSIVTSTIVGSALIAQNYQTAAIIYGITGLISLAGILIYRKVSGSGKKAQTKTNKSSAPSDPGSPVS
ncbi:MAG TPA: VTT domain-containing protein [Candidatus Limiplasma sp.]|nr:VTT domain-containing protein [Candidatus Limiplasma sp.]